MTFLVAMSFDYNLNVHARFSLLPFVQRKVGAVPSALLQIHLECIEENETPVHLEGLGEKSLGLRHLIC